MHRVKFSSGILLYQDPVLAPKQGRVQRLDLSRGIRMTPSQVDMAALVPLCCPLVFQSLVSGPTACACTAPYNYDSHTFFLWKIRIIGFSEFGQAVKKTTHKIHRRFSVYAFICFSRLRFSTFRLCKCTLSLLHVNVDDLAFYHFF